MLDYDATEAYLEICRINKEVDVCGAINDAIADGQGHIIFWGFIPAPILEYLDSKGYRVIPTTRDRPEHEAKFYHYLIQWGPEK